MRQIKKYRRFPADPVTEEVTYPTEVESHRSGFRSLIRTLPAKDIDGAIDENHHDSQVFLGTQYIFHSPSDLFSKSSAHYRALISFMLLFFVDPQLTIIDEDLHAYPPEK